MDMGTLLAKSVRLFAERPAVQWAGRRLTFAESWQRGLRCASLLDACGVRPGERVGVLEANSVAAVDLLLATAILGTPRVPLYVGGDRDRNAAGLVDTGAVGLVADGALEDEARALGEQAGLRWVLVRDDYEERLAAAPPYQGELAPCSPEDVYVIRQTGGTSGRPKLVPYMHRTWIAASQDWFYPFPLMREDDVHLLVSPLAHGGMYFFTTAWASGAMTVIPEDPQPQAWAEAIAHDGVTHTFMVPPVAAMIADAYESQGFDDCRLRVMALAGGPAPTPLLARLVSIFGPTVWHAYGLTEAVPIAMLSAEELADHLRDGHERAASAGRVLPFADALVLDGDESLPPRRVGELAVRSNAQMPGYLVDGALQPNTSEWIRTSDAGWLDESGHLFVVDRLREGFPGDAGTVWPAQVEQALATLLDASEVAVFPSAEGPVRALHYRRGADGPSEAAEVEVTIRQPDGRQDLVRVLVRRSPVPLPRTAVGKMNRPAARAAWADLEA